jgi:hypothetical protein
MQGNKALAEQVEHSMPKTEKQPSAKFISPLAAHLVRENEETNYVFITIKGE